MLNQKAIHNVSKICNCTHCGACSIICPVQCISMAMNPQGFCVPTINDAVCINCGKCLKICPADKNNGVKPKAIYGVRHHDKSVVKFSTSGGAFTAISDVILDDRGYVCGAIYNEQFKVHHICTNDSSIRDCMRGAKYVKSDNIKAFSKIIELLKEGKLVLFSGTPCQVAAIRELAIESKCPLEGLFTIDIICHGVPSPQVFSDHISDIINRYGAIKEYKFRDKNIGWRGQNTTVLLQDGTILAGQDIASYSRLYFDSFITSDSCHKCPYSSSKRVGDITIGDFWGVEKSNPQYDDNLGTSLVLVNTPKGDEMFKKIKHLLLYWDTSLEECMQVNLQHPTPINKRKNIFWRYYKKYGYYIAMKRTVLYSKTKIFLGRISRAPLWLFRKVFK